MMNLIDDLDSTPVSDESLVERMRLHRNRLLVESDWTQLPDAPVDREAWATYRQTLRDFPASWTPSPTVNFPEAP
jgi:hypothetical protein